MKIDFKGKIVLITGGTSGIGKQLVKDFLKLNAKVICTTTKIDKYKDKKNLYFKDLDLNNILNFNKFLNEIKKFKKVDVLINNAGINKIDPINQIQSEDWQKIYNVKRSV